MNNRKPAPSHHDWPIELTFQLFVSEPETVRSPYAHSIEPPEPATAWAVGEEIPDSR